MGTFSIWHWINALPIFSIISMISVVPFWRLFRRTGIPPILSIFALIPFVAFFYLWVVAFKKWPSDT
ncbi:hypothetical protein CRT60_21740 [Azospirillum palustre]|uniref:Uncharacterized protein n=1 Tax=Azospirillum palustre TaxID=2044885 RepID=A0A2B8BF48_9PROT|nr:hypothetical protein CRT60_21740 [Azospirillum palustre]